MASCDHLHSHSPVFIYSSCLHTHPFQEPLVSFQSHLLEPGKDDKGTGATPEEGGGATWKRGYQAHGRAPGSHSAERSHPRKISTTSIFLILLVKQKTSWRCTSVRSAAQQGSCPAPETKHPLHSSRHPHPCWCGIRSS